MKTFQPLNVSVLYQCVVAFSNDRYRDIHCIVCSTSRSMNSVVRNRDKNSRGSVQFLLFPIGPCLSVYCNLELNEDGFLDHSHSFEKSGKLEFIPATLRIELFL